MAPQGGRRVRVIEAAHLSRSCQCPFWTAVAAPPTLLFGLGCALDCSRRPETFNSTNVRVILLVPSLTFRFGNPGFDVAPPPFRRELARVATRSEHSRPPSSVNNRAGTLESVRRRNPAEKAAVSSLQSRKHSLLYDAKSSLPGATDNGGRLNLRSPSLRLKQLPR